MAKEKLNITLDPIIKAELQALAQERHMTVSALITDWVLNQPKAKIIKGQQSLIGKEKQK